MNIVETKEQAIAYLKEAKKNKKVAELAKALQCDPSWIYKVINGLVKPSLERCLLVLNYKENNQE